MLSESNQTYKKFTYYVTLHIKFKNSQNLSIALEIKEFNLEKGRGNLLEKYMRKLTRVMEIFVYQFEWWFDCYVKLAKIFKLKFLLLCYFIL